MDAVAGELLLDPSQLTPLPPPTPDNLLELLGDNDLLQAKLTLRLACGRSHTVFHPKNRTVFCILWRVLDEEQRRRNFDIR
jgi:hypothetical protein